MASSEALLWQDMGEMMTGTRRFIHRMMLQPFVPVLEIVQKVFQRLMWLLTYLARGEVKWGQNIFETQNLVSDPSGNVTAKIGMSSEFQLQSLKCCRPGHVSDWHTDLSTFLALLLPGSSKELLKQTRE